jgi:hypothetical protein
MSDLDRDQLQRAFSVELGGPPPGAEERVLRGLDYSPRPRRQRWLSVAAAALAGLLVVTLLGARALGARLPAPELPKQGALSLPDAPPPATPTAAPSATPSTSTCRLPIVRNGAGGFVTVDASAPPPGSGMPAQTQASADPAARVSLPDGETAAGLTYSWQLGRWLPVVPAWVSPDGARYAYTDREGVLHVVNASIGQDRAVNHDRTWAVIAFQADGVYAAALSASAVASGLWQVDPASGHARQVQAAGQWVAVSAGAAWELTTDSKAPAPPSFLRPGEATGNVVTRLDLRTGRLDPMYASSTELLEFVGVDAAGDGLVSDVRGPSALLLVSGPGRVTVDAAGAWSGALADGSRTWLGDFFTTSVRLLDAGHDATVVVQVNAGTGGSIQVAGPCR